MRIVLCLLGIGFGCFALFINETAETFMQQQVYSLFYIVGAILFGSGCIMSEVGAASDKLSRQLTNIKKEISDQKQKEKGS